MSETNDNINNINNTKEQPTTPTTSMKKQKQITTTTFKINFNFQSIIKTGLIVN